MCAHTHTHTHTHTDTHTKDVKMYQHAIWKQSCYLLSVLITVITGNSADESLCCFLPLSPRLTRCSGELFPGPGASLNHLSCSALLCIALTARAADCSITLSQSDYICFKNEGLSARKICQTLLHFAISQNAWANFQKTGAAFTAHACSSQVAAGRLTSCAFVFTITATDCQWDMCF